MCECLALLLASLGLPHHWETLGLPHHWETCRSSFAVFWQRLQSWFSIPEVELFRMMGSGQFDPQTPYAFRRRLSLLNAMHASSCVERKPTPESTNGSKAQLRTINGGDDLTSLHTRQGLKGVNQDVMLVWKDFASLGDTVFCGVFDGHGPHGHLVAQNVRDMLPEKLACLWKYLQESCTSSSHHECTRASAQFETKQHRQFFPIWRDSFVNAFKMMDTELLADKKVDCFSSGSTAVTLIKQGRNLIVANIGDSRAVLGIRMDDKSLSAVQLTVDLTPNLPKEAERIRKCHGRVFALNSEPSIMRVWLPHENAPGLAMARAFGDFSLKNFGVISVPEITFWQVRDNDQFVVLATDGVWDVLSNKQVVEIVDSAPMRSLAAKAVVDVAFEVWKLKSPHAKVDDCAVVCLFLDSFQNSSNVDAMDGHIQ